MHSAGQILHAWRASRPPTFSITGWLFKCRGTSAAARRRHGGGRSFCRTTGRHVTWKRSANDGAECLRRTKTNGLRHHMKEMMPCDIGRMMRVIGERWRGMSEEDKDSWCLLAEDPWFLSSGVLWGQEGSPHVTWALSVLRGWQQAIASHVGRAAGIVCAVQPWGERLTMGAVAV